MAMTEQEWLNCTDPLTMLRFVQGKASDRKQRLFAISCCRRMVYWFLEVGKEHRLQLFNPEERRTIAQNIKDYGGEPALQIAERWAEGEVSADELRQVHPPAWRGQEPFQILQRFARGLGTLEDVAEACVRGARLHTFDSIIGFVDQKRWNEWEWSDSFPDDPEPQCSEAEQEERLAQSNCLRDAIGNLFHPYPAAPSVPDTVTWLAQALYSGQDCCLPLSDALEEAGQGELAEHFRNGPWHPKGCWGVDLILGKE